MNCSVTNAMSVDVEDYFQVAAFAQIIDRADWDKLEWRVEQNTEKALELFAKHDVKATFFVLGWSFAQNRSFYNIKCSFQGISTI